MNIFFNDELGNLDVKFQAQKASQEAGIMSADKVLALIRDDNISLGKFMIRQRSVPDYVFIKKHIISPIKFTPEIINECMRITPRWEKMAYRYITATITQRNSYEFLVSAYQYSLSIIEKYNELDYITSLSYEDNIALITIFKYWEKDNFVLGGDFLTIRDIREVLNDAINDFQTLRNLYSPLVDDNWKVISQCASSKIKSDILFNEAIHYISFLNNNINYFELPMYNR